MTARTLLIPGWHSHADARRGTVTFEKKIDGVRVSFREPIPFGLQSVIVCCEPSARAAKKNVRLQMTVSLVDGRLTDETRSQALELMRTYWRQAGEMGGMWTLPVVEGDGSVWRIELANRPSLIPAANNILRMMAFHAEELMKQFVKSST